VGICPLKINIFTLENQYFQRLKYQNNRAVSTFLLVFETLKKGGGKPTFSEMRVWL